MTLTQILADIYRRTGFSSSPPSEVSTRITAFVNETQQEILREGGMQFLLNDVISFTSVADTQTYGLSSGLDKIKTIRDATNTIFLEPMSLEEYRIRYPDPSANTGLPTRWVDMGFDAVHTEPSDASTIYVDSTSALDTGTAYIEGILSDGNYFTASVTMTGTTAVAFNPTTVIDITKFFLSANASGNVTLHEDAEGGTTLATIRAGTSHSRYRNIALVPTPSSAVTYRVDYERIVPDMSIGTDQPVLPEKFHYLLSVGGRMKEYEKTNDLARWTLAKQEYDSGLKKLKFWIYQQTVGAPNLRGFAFTRPSVDDGTTLAQASAVSSPTSAANGGTGFSSYTIGDMLAADTTTTLSKLTAVASGQVLTSAGVGALPAWSGSPTLSGNLTVQGNTTLGNAAADTITLTGTVTSNVLFTDNTYDIGASGATRPRDLFLSRNATVGGSLTVSANVDLSGAAAGQIAFPASQNAASGANTLDDYEEGTWTPVIGGTGGESGQAYSHQTGRYVKVGKMVYANFSVLLSTEGTITGNVQIKGLPYTAVTSANGATGNLYLGYFTSLATTWVWIGGNVDSAGTTATLFGLTAAATGVGNLVAADINDTTRFIGTLVYEAAN
jgi:hypothetical protein